MPRRVLAPRRGAGARAAALAASSASGVVWDETSSVVASYLEQNRGETNVSQECTYSEASSPPPR